MKPTSQEMASEYGPLVEVTLQSLSGLTCRFNQGTRRSIPNVTAAVGFSGSATDMQVSSSFLCGTSGNVVVESQAVHSQHVGDVDNQNRCALVAEWHGGDGLMNSASRRSFSSSPSSAQSVHQPHLTIRLPKRDPKLPSVPLSRMNRDCNVVHDRLDPPSLDESETSSQTRPHVARDDESEVRGTSVVWSASGAAMPEIIELHVSLIMDADHRAKDSEADGHSEYKIPLQKATFQVGIAYLVFYGSDDGTTVLDLPIKKQLAEHSSFEHPDVTMTLDDNAYLRVCVTVSANGQKQLNSPSPQSLPYTNDMRTLEPILRQLHMAHDDHQRDLRRQKLQHAKEEKPLEDRKLGMGIEPPGGFFCGGDMGVLDIIKSFSNTIRQCDDGEGALHRSDSMGSTIVTSASLGI